MPQRDIEVFAYYTGTERAGRAYTNLVQYNRLLSSIGIFSYDINQDGTLIGATNPELIAEVRGYGVTVLAVITNFVDGQFSPELAHTVLANPVIRGRLVESIYQLIRMNGYNGVNLDIENVAPADRELFTALVRELSQRLAPAGLILSMAVPAKTGDFPEREWIGAFDYSALAQYNDFLMVMTYEFHWAGGEPGPIAPIPWMQEVLAYILSQIPPGKVLLGIPMHGYNWVVPPQSGVMAPSVSYWQAVELSQLYGVPVQWNEAAKETFFTYSVNGVRHEVWFQGLNSLATKMDLVNEYELRGIGIWPLSLTFPDFWALVEQMFTVMKR